MYSCDILYNQTCETPTWNVRLAIGCLNRCLDVRVSKAMHNLYIIGAILRIQRVFGQLYTASYLQGSTPRDLAIQFQKQNCVSFLELAESEVDAFDYKESESTLAHLSHSFSLSLTLSLAIILCFL